MPKRAPLDPQQFQVALPPQARDPLDSIIPTAPQSPANQAPPKTGETATSPKRENAERRTRETAKMDGMRPRTRQGFDVFRDQIVALNELQVAFYRKTGKKPSMGEMVRTALDEQIAKKRRELESQ